MITEDNGKPPSYSRQAIIQALNFDFAFAYWISPEGKIKEVKTTHIRDVINNPKGFRLKVEYIREIYKKFNEGLGSEGAARDEIVKALTINGWTRTRFMISGDYFSIDVGRLDARIREYLFEWASKIIELKPESRKFRVALVENAIAKSSIYQLEDLVKEEFLCKENINEPITYYLIPLKIKEDFLDNGPAVRMENKLREL